MAEESPLEVSCYSGHTYAQRPQSLRWMGQKHEVKAVRKEWHEPGKTFFEVITEEDKLFRLCYNEALDQWSAAELVR